MSNNSSQNRTCIIFTHILIVTIMFFATCSIIINGYIYSSSDIWVIDCPSNQIPVIINNTSIIIPNNCFHQPTYDENIVCISAKDNSHGWSAYRDISWGNKSVTMFKGILLLIAFWLNIFEIIEKNQMCCADCINTLLEIHNQRAFPYIELTDIKSSDPPEESENKSEKL